MGAQDSASVLRQQVQQLNQDVRHQTSVAEQAEQENASLLDQLNQMASQAAAAQTSALAAPTPDRATEPVPTPKKTPKRSPATPMSQAVVPQSDPEARNLNMLTQMITQLEESKLVAYEQLKQSHSKESDLQDTLDTSEE